MAGVDIESEAIVQSAGQDSVVSDHSRQVVDDIIAPHIKDTISDDQILADAVSNEDGSDEEVTMGLLGSVLSYFTWGLGEVTWYLANPPVLFSHLILIALLFHLYTRGVRKRELLVLALVEETLAVLLWFIIPNSLGIIVAILISIFIYESVLGPKLVLRNNAVLISDDDISDSLRHYCPNLKFDVTKQPDGSHHVNTYLRYTEYHHAFWTQRDPTSKGVKIDEVTRVEEGCDYAIIRAIRNANAEPRQCFYMTLGKERGHMVTLIAESGEERDKWLSAMQQFLGHRVEDLRSNWLGQLFTRAQVSDVSGGTVTLDDAVSIMTAAQRPTDRPYVANLFTVFAKLSGIKTSAGDAALSKEQFDKFFDLASSQTEIKRIYEKMLDQKNGELLLPPHKFHSFIEEEQKENVTMNVVKSWMKSYETVVPSMNMSLIGFSNYFLSDEQALLHRDHLSVCQDMTRPLSHYFIATSHNTYLTKDQLKGKSSVDAYISAFKRGCKCVELDCWDGPNNEPIIYHGHTLTSKILFKDVVEAIHEYAFIVSDYPVILSFENHCSLEQQKVMAQYLINILGEKLHNISVPEDEKALPSPEDLKGYIIVKNKKLKPGQDDFDEIDDDFSDDDITEEDIIAVETEDNDEKASEDNNNGDASKGRKSGSLRGLFNSSTKRSSSKKSSTKGPKIAQELSDLVHYCQATHFRNFDYSRENARHNEMSSFAEKRAMKFSKEDFTKFLQYNERQLSRIYPAGGRIDSSNYDPIALWNVGSQLVALNYQTACKEMQINQALFHTNGGCGYVLKPEFMRRDDITFDPHGPFNTWKNVAIRVLYGHQLPFSSEKSLKSERSFFVQVRQYGVEQDTNRTKTRSSKNNGFNPTWDEVLNFKVHVPELAFFQFLVFTKDPMETLICQYTIPFWAMQQGYRRLALENKYSDKLPYASLFVHVDVTEKEVEELAAETSENSL